MSDFSKNPVSTVFATSKGPKPKRTIYKYELNKNKCPKNTVFYSKLGVWPLKITVHKSLSPSVPLPLCPSAPLSLCPFVPLSLCLSVPLSKNVCLIIRIDFFVTVFQIFIHKWQLFMFGVLLNIHRLHVWLIYTFWYIKIPDVSES